MSADLNRKMLLIKSIDGSAHLDLSEWTGGWFVVSRIWQCNGVIESGITGITEHRPTPEEAVDAFFDRLTDVPLDESLRVGSGDTLRHWRWNGAAFAEDRHAHA